MSAERSQPNPAPASAGKIQPRLAHGEVCCLICAVPFGLAQTRGAACADAGSTTSSDAGEAAYQARLKEREQEGAEEEGTHSQYSGLYIGDRDFDDDDEDPDWEADSDDDEDEYEYDTPDEDASEPESDEQDDEEEDEDEDEEGEDDQDDGEVGDGKDEAADEGVGPDAHVDDFLVPARPGDGDAASQRAHSETSMPRLVVTADDNHWCGEMWCLVRTGTVEFADGRQFFDDWTVVGPHREGGGADHPGIPLHKQCLEVLGHVWERKHGRRNAGKHVGLLAEWWDLAAADGLRNGLPRDAAVVSLLESGDPQSFLRDPANEFLTADPVEIPTLASCLDSVAAAAATGDQAPSAGGFSAGSKTIPTDFLSRLPEKARMKILFNLSRESVANLHLASRAFAPVEHNLYRALLLRDAPWVWEAWPAEGDAADEQKKKNVDWETVFREVTESESVGLHNRRRLWGECGALLDLVGRAEKGEKGATG